MCPEILNNPCTLKCECVIPIFNEKITDNTKIKFKLLLAPQIFTQPSTHFTHPSTHFTHPSTHFTHPSTHFTHPSTHFTHPKPDK